MEDLKGRWLKALIHEPDGTDAKIGEYREVIDKGKIRWGVSRTLYFQEESIGRGWELMPIGWSPDNKESNLDKAKRLYGKGVKFKCACQPGPILISTGNIRQLGTGAIDDNTQGEPYFFSNGRWAEIIEEEVEYWECIVGDNAYPISRKNNGGSIFHKNFAFDNGHPASYMISIHPEYFKPSTEAAYTAERAPKSMSVNDMVKGEVYKILDNNAEYTIAFGYRKKDLIHATNFRTSGIPHGSGAFNASQIKSVRKATPEEKALLFPKGEEKKIMKKEDLKEGEIYIAEDSGNAFIVEYSTGYFIGCSGQNRDVNRLSGFSRGFSHSNYTYREASEDLKLWLKACIAANKFIPKEEALKKEEKWIPKEGDWVYIIKSWHGCTLPIGQAYKVTRLQKFTDICFYCNINERNSESNPHWTSIEATDCYRKALPHEIPSSTIATINTSIESNLERAKREYPIGTKFIAPDNGRTYTVKGNWYEVSGNILCYNDVSSGGQYLFRDGIWAEIISLEELWQVGGSVELLCDYGGHPRGTQAKIIKLHNLDKCYRLDIPYNGRSNENCNIFQADLKWLGMNKPGIWTEPVKVGENMSASFTVVDFMKGVEIHLGPGGKGNVDAISHQKPIMLNTQTKRKRLI